MKTETTLFITFFFIYGLLPAQGILGISNLPILVITTENGQDIQDEPKIEGHLGIIWNGPNATQHVSDEFNHYDGKIGIEVRGSSSQFLFPKVGYAFETRKEDGSNNNVSLLGMPAENDWVLNGPYSDKTLMRNALAYSLAGWIMDYAPRVRYCEVVINGDYRGVYILTEKIKRDVNRVAISQLTPDENEGDDLTGGYILKLDKYDGAGYNGFLSQHPSFPGGGFSTFFQFHYPKFDEITPEQAGYINNYIANLENDLQSVDFMDPVYGYRSYLDLPSFMQLIFIQEIGRNVDGYRLSTFFYKDKDSKGGKLKFGPVWDFNLAFGNVNYCIGSGTSGWALDFNDFCPNDNWVIHFWWDRIWQDPDYLEEMKNYWKLLRTDQLTNERIFHLVDSLDQLLHEPAARNFTRWPVLGEYIWPNDFVGNTHQQEVTNLRRWIGERLAWLDQSMEFLVNPGFNPYEFVEPEIFPNPFHNLLTFKYYCLYYETIRMEIYNAQGQLVDELIDPGPGAGWRTLDWTPNLPNGMYFYKMKFSRGKDASGIIVNNGGG